MREASHDRASFSAGVDCGTRVAACVARAAAQELLERARWWNRWRHRLMASALVACAEELEDEADSAGRPGAAEGRPGLEAVVLAGPGSAARAVARGLEPQERGLEP